MEARSWRIVRPGQGVRLVPDVPTSALKTCPQEARIAAVIVDQKRYHQLVQASCAAHRELSRTITDLLDWNGQDTVYIVFAHGVNLKHAQEVLAGISY